MSRRKLPEGLVLRGRTYWAEFRHSGRRIRKSLKTGDLKVAADILATLRGQAVKGEYGLLDNNVAIAEVWEAFTRHCRQTLKPGAVQRYAYSWQAIASHLPPKVSGLTIQTIMAYRQERLATVCPRTVNMDVGTVATMLNWAVENRLIGSNPIRGVKPLRHDRPKEGRALSDDEVDRLLKASPAYWRDIWYAFLVTGMRKNELASLTFNDIDWEARELVVQRGIAKNHHSRRIPIDDHLWEILCRQRDGRASRQPGRGKTPELTAAIQQRFSTEHVFTTPQNTPLTHRSGLYHAFIRCCGLAGIETRTEDSEGREVEHVDLHSTRRTFATSLIVNGADPRSVQSLLGHRTLEMTMGLYAKIRGGTKRQAIGRLSYGAGSKGPGYVVEFGVKLADGHEMPTVRKQAAGALA